MKLVRLSEGKGGSLMNEGVFWVNEARGGLMNEGGICYMRSKLGILAFWATFPPIIEDGINEAKGGAQGGGILTVPTEKIIGRLGYRAEGGGPYGGRPIIVDAGNLCSYRKNHRRLGAGFRRSKKRNN